MEPGNLVRSNLENGMTPQGQNPFAHLPPGTTFNFSSQEPGLADYWRILLKRKWTIAATVTIVFTLSAIYTFHLTPYYEAVCRIAINRENPTPFGLETRELSANETEDYDYTVQMDTQVRILQGESVALSVIKDLHLDSVPEFNGGTSAARALTPTQLSNEQEQGLMARLHGNMTVTIIPNTRLVEVRFRSTNPQLAAQIANAFGNDFVELNRRTKYDSTMQASEWLSNQLADLQVKVETSQQKLVQYQREHNIIGTDDKQNIVTAKLDDLNKELSAAEADRIIKQSSFQQAQTQSTGSSGAAANDLTLQKLQQDQTSLESELAQLQTQFGPAYPKVQELSNRLKQVQLQIDRQVKFTSSRAESEYHAALQRESMLHADFERQKQAANQLNQSAIEYNLLKREAESNRQLYEGLLQKLKEAGVSAGLKSSNIRVVDAARPPLAPAFPNVPRYLLMALFIGFGGGVAFAFLMEVLDNTVRSPEQVEQIAALPALGVVPLGAHEKFSLARSTMNALPAPGMKQRGKMGLVAHARPKSSMAEAYRALRTSILLAGVGQPPKTVLVTSALPQEGKTTTSVNTAIVLAQKGGRVLLIDCDMRRPGVAAILGISNARGLSNVLSGSLTPEEVTIASRQVKNLYVIPAGPPPPHPAEMLSSDRMKSLIEQFRNEYDHIVIDTPPTLSVTDAVLLSVVADSVILVIRSGKTTKDALRRSRDVLRQVNARVMGVVVNAIDLSSADMNYQYYYGSKYGGRYYDENVGAPKS